MLSKSLPCAAAHTGIAHIWEHPPGGRGSEGYAVCTWQGAYLAPLFNQKLNVSLRVREMMCESSAQASQEPALHITTGQ